MFKCFVLCLIFTSLSASAYETVIRITSANISYILSKSNLLNEEGYSDGYYDAEHRIRVKVFEKDEITFIKEGHDLTSESPEAAKEIIAKMHSDLLIKLNSIRSNTVRVIEKVDSVVCAKSYIDAVVNENNEVIHWELGLKPKKCP